MALTPHSREFKITTGDISLTIKPQTGATDSVVIEFVGKLNPSTKKRIHKALLNGDFQLRERVIA